MTTLVNEGNFDEIKRYLINNGIAKTANKFMISRQYCYAIDRTTNYKEFRNELKRNRQEYYTRLKKKQQEDKQFLDTGNRIHFAGSGPLGSPFKTGTSRPEVATTTISNVPTPTQTVERAAKHFTNEQVETIKRMAAAGEFANDIANAVGHPTAGAMYYYMKDDEKMKAIWSEYMEKGKEVRKARTAEKRMDAIDKSMKTRAENIKKKNRSKGQRKYWATLTEEERKDRVRRSNEARARTRMLKKGGGDAIEDKSETVAEENEAKTQEQMSFKVSEEVINEYKREIAKRELMGNDVKGWLEFTQSDKLRHSNQSIFVAAVFMTLTLVMMKFTDTLQMELINCFFPMFFWLGMEVAGIFLIGLVVSLLCKTQPINIVPCWHGTKERKKK